MVDGFKESNIVNIAYYILVEGVNKRASDIFIEPLDDELQIRLRVDGILHKLISFPLEMHPKVLTRIKVMSNLNVSEHRLPQDGGFKIKLPGKEVDFRVSIMPSRLGEKAVLRILDKERLILDINRLGFDAHSLTALKESLSKPYGVILICGSTGSGKTSTLYASIKHIDSVEKNIVTVEDPVEYQLYGINQVQVKEEVGFTFPIVLRSILRQDPDIVLVGEVRDSETAEIAVRMALTGHLVLTTIHATTSTGGIIRLINMGIEPFLISSSCLLIASQSLVRLLCEECKEPYSMPEIVSNQMKKCGYDRNSIPEKIYRTKGCSKCNQSGYFGRTAIMEALSFTSKIQELIENNVSEDEIRKEAKAEGMETLRKNTFDLLRRGLTSTEEIGRLTNEKET